MAFIKIVSLILFFSLLSSSFLFSKNKVPDHIIYADQVQREFIREMEEKYGCICIGTSGSMPKNIKDIGVDFALYHRATIEEARSMEVLAVERFTEMLNADEKIRPYLCEYPFPYDRAEVAFSFYTPFGTSFADGNLMHISQIRGKLFYDSRDPTTGRFIRLLEEPYAEAKKIVEASPIPNPFAHQGKPHEPLIDAIFAAYLKEMWKKYGLECERIGGKLTDGIDEIVVRLIYFHPTHMDKARELQVVATEKILEAINGNEQLRPYIKNYPLSLDQLKVFVLFRKRNYYSYDSNKESLESVSQDGNKVNYFIEPDEDFKDPIICATESYQECATKVRNSSRGKKLKVKWQKEN